MSAERGRSAGAGADSPAGVSVSNLAWPMAPYSSAHRPIRRQVPLLTGVSVTAVGWSLVHVPVHRTRTLDIAGLHLGVHAVLWGTAESLLTLDDLLLAARRQADTLAGWGVCEPLRQLAAKVTEARLPCPGMGTLLSDWMREPAWTPGALGRRPAGRARLLDVARMAVDLPTAASALLAEHRSGAAGPVRSWDEVGPHQRLAELVMRAARIAVVAGAATGRFTLPDGYGSRQLAEQLDDAAGDLLPFRKFGPDAETGGPADLGSAHGDHPLDAAAG